jgi:NADH:ubiquinone oxidoreductase subunit K
MSALMNIGLDHFLVVSAMLFGLATYTHGLITGQVFALFIIVLAAAEAAIALAIVLSIFRHFHSIDANETSTLRE